MRIWLSTAPLAFRLKGAGGGAVDNRNRQGLHLRNPKTCPNKLGHLSLPHGGTGALFADSVTSLTSARISQSGDGKGIAVIGGHDLAGGEVLGQSRA